MVRPMPIKQTSWLPTRKAESLLVECRFDRQGLILFLQTSAHLGQKNGKVTIAQNKP